MARSNIDPTHLDPIDQSTMGNAIGTIRSAMGTTHVVVLYVISKLPFPQKYDSFVDLYNEIVFLLHIWKGGGITKTWFYCIAKSCFCCTHGGWKNKTTKIWFYIVQRNHVSIVLFFSPPCCNETQFCL